jgi:hypothetical protein
MGFNIEEFRTNIATEGYIDNNNFEVLISTPPALLNSSLNNQGTTRQINNIANNMRFRIDSVRAPGINLQTAQVSRYGIGSVQNMPINAQFQDAYISILIDEFGELWQFWHNWLNLIFGFNGQEAAQSGSANEFPSYQASYKDEYSTTVMIIVYDHFGNAIQKINLLQCFPTSLREIPFAWGEAQLIKLNIALSYTSYALVGSSLEPHGPPPPRTRARSYRDVTREISP